MGNNSILKLLDKRRKLDGNIDLNSFEKCKESTPVYGSNARYWFKFDDGRVLFKGYEDRIEAYGEVLYSKIAEKYGINCAKYDFASYKDEQGTISYDLGFGKNKMVIDGVTLFARYDPDLPPILKKNSRSLEVMLMFNKKYNNYEELSKMFRIRYPDDAKELESQLIKTFILDVLLDHVDKNLWNILIVTDEYGKHAKMFSIDSSHIARLNEGAPYIKSAINSLLTSDGSVTIEDYLSGGAFGYDVDSKDKDYNPIKNLIDFYYNLDSFKRGDLLDFIKNMEINSVIEELNKDNIMDPLINTWINAVFNARKTFILKKLYHISDNNKQEHTKKNFHLRKRK